MNQTTQLAAGLIDGRDRLQIILVKPGQGRPALVQLLWPTRPTVVDAGQYPHTAAAIMRLFAEASIALAASKLH